ncbi:MAG: MBL fold metallo-hydrolase [Lentisphaeria bacterium]
MSSPSSIVGSVAVTVLGSGSKGNALVVQAGGFNLLVDAGFSGRELRRRLEGVGLGALRLDAALVTHEHDDHVKGLRVTAGHYRLPAYCSRLTAEALRSRDAAPERLHLFTPGAAFAVGPFEVEPFSIPHDAIDPVGFTLRVGPVKLGLATDLGHVSHLVAQHLLECDLLLVESNHDVKMVWDSGRPWNLKRRILGNHGHLSNDACSDLLRKVLHPRTRHLVLAHASQECNRYELIEQVARQCVTSLGRADLAPRVARQDDSLSTLWV